MLCCERRAYLEFDLPFHKLIIYQYYKYKPTYVGTIYRLDCRVPVKLRKTTCFLGKRISICGNTMFAGHVGRPARVNCQRMDLDDECKFQFGHQWTIWGITVYRTKHPITQICKWHNKVWQKLEPVECPQQVYFSGANMCQFIWGRWLLDNWPGALLKLAFQTLETMRWVTHGLLWTLASE